MNGNAALLDLTKTQINSNEALQTFVNRARELTIPLFPETVQFTDSALKYGAAIVTVDTNLDGYGNNKDIYKNETGGFCLHLTKINEIAQQAGVTVTDSRILERKVDELGGVVFIEYQVRGKLRSVDGSVKEDVATGKYDYHRDCQKYISKKNGEPLINMINSRRSHAEALAESNAKTRLYNKMLAKLPSSFTLQELQKPFLIPYVLEDKNEILKDLDPQDQRILRFQLAQKRLGIAESVFGGPESKPVEDVEPLSVENEIPHNLSNGNGNNTPPNPPVQNQAPTLNPDEDPEILAEEYRDQSQAVRTEKILTLIKVLDYKDPNGASFNEARIANNSLDGQINFLKKLFTLKLEKKDDLV